MGKGGARKVPVPRTDREAIEFAVYHLDQFDVQSFLFDWLTGESIEKYLHPEGRQTCH
ncbi:hypothetical protein GCM10011491_12720 [Brucella endophytica]|uniref:Uncharacterized protein n=1 Tax=Brucella endophytica TaxID=1963359 RepID=A0A916S6G1_9HYPH|nr:hypothetical protein [Brucella endophytica]GGA86529.1 hypothetical protein GCM10011491_12720 [Brucella endophytica]